MTVRIAETYFQRVLHHSEPTTAVYELAGWWSAREALDTSKPFFGLAEAEFYVRLYLAYAGEVGNGGHAQFFMNPMGRYAAQVAHVLQAMELTPLGAIFQEARGQFSGGVPADDAARQTAIQALDPDALDTLARLDRAFYRHDGEALETVLSFLRQHQDAILLPERGLSDIAEG